MQNLYGAESIHDAFVKIIVTVKFINTV